MTELPTVSEILKEEFMEPMGISAYKLAKEIKVPTSRVQDILHGRRQITPDTSIRLGRYFGVSDGYFLNIQVEILLRRGEEKNQNIFNSIVPLSQTQWSL
ncbi:HigA family addiction module antidote protein [Ligilactobacillus agilis]|uniref:HigA family addiction module antitoxin n=1 Tax=Ligilactobacillus agilis TaxID=1601 RepID=UPI001F56E581|nr:HigA family addiction module antitoxin [Ligilactobacillus agilis]UNL41754.1 HigA family addiction module antidote protein [Ligilactobacillus agilis]UNL58815.1 HigA family addiction module antidote protein [Ligilactobacillus agilis]